MTIRAWGRTGQWDKLLEVLTRDDSGGRPHEASGRNSNWMAVEAAQALTAAPDQTVGPLMKLLSETDKRQPLRSMWVCYALALTQTEQAAAALKTRLAQSQNWYVTCDYVYMLSLAGEPGRRVLDELAPKSHSSQADAIERLAAGKLDVTAIAEPPLPPIPAGLTLPGAR
jgi:HEAT repeat protein